ncbi:hypothetical protein SL054_000868 [Flavobacterium psychrophilum]|uniref:YCF48-related protein n=1 Tax=Flavobacterium psychrophilum TaxID=96345 RepID=UPI000A3BB90A|nr:YCF48-related protein [Flavobacterium psychrophilum]EKT4499395.1 hypothetical protein [Flavobacterium psychrophilum]ELM3643570.1 hypothetical protein [Flavobacterium psychrophilum]ELM3650433.1 hypothetical protein [Flavobacterium psychrophilum]ELM3671612.1 hypothetical protein [Flavobacterium psychrophilum]ELM3725752.1 hypothetical protein [Flavobacterium psychrophilum]
MKTSVLKHKAVIGLIIFTILAISCTKESFPEPKPKVTDYAISTNSLILNSIINDIDFKGLDTGFAVGTFLNGIVQEGVILKTNNAGKDWQKLVSPALLGQFYSNYFIDNQTGWIVGDLGTILKTTNGGTTFTTQTSGTTERLYAVTFADANNGVCVGAKGIIRTTTNGGATWEVKNSGLTSSTDLRAVYIYNATTIIVCGSNGVLRRSNDFGLTWGVITTQETVRLQDMHFPIANIGYICGQEGVVLKINLTDNTVTKQYLPVDEQMRAIYFVNEQIGYTSGSYGDLLKTTNGGQNWKLQNIDPIAYNLYSIDFPTEKQGYIAGVRTLLTTNTK